MFKITIGLTNGIFNIFRNAGISMEKDFVVITANHKETRYLKNDITHILIMNMDNN